MNAGRIIDLKKKRAGTNSIVDLRNSKTRKIKSSSFDLQEKEKIAKVEAEKVERYYQSAKKEFAGFDKNKKLGEVAEPVVKQDETDFLRSSEGKKKKFLKIRKNKQKESISIPNVLREGFKSKGRKRKSFSLSFSQIMLFKKPLAFFIIICLFSVSTIQVFAYVQTDLLSKKDKIISSAEVAYQYMDSGQQSILAKDYDAASYKFDVAEERFTQAHDELNILGDSITNLLTLIPGGAQVASANNLLEAGSSVAVASKYVSSALVPFTQTGSVWDSLKQEEIEDINSEISFTDAISASNRDLYQAFVKLEEAEEYLNKVNINSLPENVQGQIGSIIDKVPTLKGVIVQYLSYSQVILNILGKDNPRKYLFLFQNNRELRATGGFIGTYGIFNINEGEVEDLKIEGPYHIDGQLLDNIASPEPLRLIVDRFYMRDANWFADFPTSAEKVMSLYEKSGGATVDGVIAVTANFMQDLMGVVGPIEMPEYDKTVTAENFFNETQQQVEFDYDKEENRPKKFLADMFPKIIERFSDLDKDKWPEVLNILFASLEEKETLMYFQDDNIQKLVTSFGWEGSLTKTKGDYLNIITANVGGGKTDHVVSQDSYLDTEIKSDGSIINTLTIVRKHNGDTAQIFEDVKNVTYQKIYVPLGSQLLEAEGFDDGFFGLLKEIPENYEIDEDLEDIERRREIHEESQTRITKETGKTVFGNWMGVEAGKKKVVRIKYKLPFRTKITDDKPYASYSLVLQKQPGAIDRNLYGNIKVPDNWEEAWDYSSNDFLLNNKEYKVKIDRDNVMGMIFTER